MKIEMCALFVALLLIVTSVSMVATGIVKNGMEFEDITTDGSGIISPTWSGNGTEDNPYMIENVTHLQNMSADLTAHYALANDIDASATREWNGGEGLVPIGDGTTPFTGSLDGKNHTITGLYISIGDYLGLFGEIGNGGEVHNVGVTDAFVSGHDRVGILVGHNNQGLVSNSYATGNVFGNNYVGGLIGMNWLGKTSQSYSSADVVGSLSVGGLVGYHYLAMTNNSYSTGDVTRISGSTETNIGGFAGLNYQGKIIDCYSTGMVEVEDGDPLVVNGFTGYVNTGGDYEMTGNFWDNQTSGQISTAGNATGNTTAEMMTQTTFTDAGWNFTDTWWMVDGETRPFLQMEWNTKIRNSHQLQLMLMDLTVDYTLERDIDLTDYITDANRMWGTDLSAGLGFKPVGHNTNIFTGSFDGGNYNITGLYINRSVNNNVGLFGYIGTNGEVRNTGVVDAEVRGKKFVGGLLGYNREGAVSNSFATGTVSGTDENVGGLVGYNYGGTLSNSYATGTVSGTDSYVGGLVGYNYGGTVSNSYATGDVSGDWYVGGLLGHDLWGTVLNSYATGDVSGSGSVGGLVGSTYGNTVENCYATGKISGVGANIGGLVGYKYQGTVSSSYASGNVRSTNRRVGGLVGFQSGGTVENSYAMGTVTRGPPQGITYTDFGGFIGENNQGKIINCYSTGGVHYEDANDPTNKGFAGYVNTGGGYEMTGNFWDVDTSGQNETAGNATGKTTAEMISNTTFSSAGWDIALVEDHDLEIWYIDDGNDYPRLWWEEYVAPVTFDISLFAGGESDGWNFVSFNLEIRITSLTSILANIDGYYDRVMYYDAENSQWQSYVPGRAEHFNNLDTWNRNMGIWIRMIDDTNLTVKGYVPTSTDITLYPGWNMVGLPSSTAGNHGLPTEVTKIGYFNATAEYNLAYDYVPWNFTFEPGQGYLIYNGEDYNVVWTIEY